MNCTPPELFECLRTEPRVWVRLAADRPDDEWRLSVLEITAGGSPPAWRTQRWLYERAAFVASVKRGSSVARWFHKRRVSPGPLSLTLPDLHEQVQVEWRESRWAGIYEALEWPSEVWTVSSGGGDGHHLFGELVADGAPAFLDFDRAAMAFLGLPQSPNRRFASGEVVFRRQDRRGRIESVHVRPTELAVEVAGEALGGCSLTLGGDSSSPTRKLTKRSHLIRLPLATELPPGAWLALHRDRELIDRRLLESSWSKPGIEVEIDPETRLEVLLARGEGPQVEFKREFGDEPRTLMKTVAAFANGAGGAIVLGVDDDGVLVGLPDRSGPGDRDRLTTLIRDWVRPLVSFEVESVAAGGRRVIIIDVAVGPDPPYGVGTSERDVTYYVRRGATSFPASPADVRSLARSRPSSHNDQLAAYLSTIGR